MRILHIIPNLNKGGAERLCIDICHELKQQGEEVKLILLDDSNEYETLSEGLDITIVNSKPFIRKGKQEFSNISELIEATNKFKPNIVHTHLFQAEFTWKCTKINIPTVFHVHDNIKAFEPFKNNSLPKEKLIAKIEKTRYFHLLKKSKTTFLCISEDTKEYILRKIHAKNLDIQFIPNAINHSLFYSNQRRSLASIDLISIGSLVPKKGHSFLIDVVTQLKKKSTKKISLKILGDGPLKAELQKQIAECKIENEVKLLGKISNPEKLLSQCNLYIHGATEEPFGLVLLEAMASGLPIVCINGGGNKDLIRNGSNGYIIDNQNVSEFVDIILSIMENEEKYFSMSNEAQLFSKDYDIKGYVAKLVPLYNKKQ